MAAATMKVRNPRNGALDYEFAITPREEVARHCAEVRAAQPGWHGLGVEGRAAVLREFGRAVAGDAGALFAALSADTGRQRIARIEIAGVGAILERAIADATAVLAPASERPTSFPGIATRPQLVPFPVVGVIAPWNFPLLLSMVDTLPALMAGCGVVLKPSEVTQRYVDPLAAIVGSIPALAAVLRIVRGPGPTGQDVIDHVDAVAFTGSVRTGRLVAEHAGRRFIPAFLELGGKDPALVLRSADLDRAAQCIVCGSIGATGQACQSLERVYVDQAVYEPFLERLLAYVRQARLTLDPAGGHVGPFIFARQAEVVREHIEDAVAKGATIRHGGRVFEQDGALWCEPTVLTGVDHSMKVMTEETFGPVIPVMPFADAAEAIRLANDSAYGLSASVFAGDEAEAQAVAERLHAGFVSINDASMSSFVNDVEWEGFSFSGLGRARMGPAGIERYLRTKAIVTNRGPGRKLADYAESGAPRG